MNSQLSDIHLTKNIIPISVLINLPDEVNILSISTLADCHLRSHSYQNSYSNPKQCNGCRIEVLEQLKHK